MDSRLFLTNKALIDRVTNEFIILSMDDPEMINSEDKFYSYFTLFLHRLFITKYYEEIITEDIILESVFQLKKYILHFFVISSVAIFTQKKKRKDHFLRTFLLTIIQNPDFHWIGLLEYVELSYIESESHFFVTPINRGEELINENSSCFYHFHRLISSFRKGVFDEYYRKFLLIVAKVSEIWIYQREYFIQSRFLRFRCSSYNVRKRNKK